MPEMQTVPFAPVRPDVCLIVPPLSNWKPAPDRSRVEAAEQPAGLPAPMQLLSLPVFVITIAPRASGSTYEAAADAGVNVAFVHVPAVAERPPCVAGLGMSYAVGAAVSVTENVLLSRRLSMQ